MQLKKNQSNIEIYLELFQKKIEKHRNKALFLMLIASIFIVSTQSLLQNNQLFLNKNIIYFFLKTQTTQTSRFTYLIKSKDTLCEIPKNEITLISISNGTLIGVKEKSPYLFNILKSRKRSLVLDRIKNIKSCKPIRLTYGN